MYFDAPETQADADEDENEEGRPGSPRAESDLDSMSFARDQASSSYSVGSSAGQQSFCYQLGGDASASVLGPGPGTTKTLRFEADRAIDVGVSGGLEQEDVSFARALGCEYDEIARKVRDDPI